MTQYAYPNPQEFGALTITDAIKHIARDGGRIRRRAWRYESSVGVYLGKYLHWMDHRGWSDGEATLSLADLEATDWERAP